MISSIFSRSSCELPPQGVPADVKLVEPCHVVSNGIDVDDEHVHAFTDTPGTSDFEDLLFAFLPALKVSGQFGEILRSLRLLSDDSPPNRTARFASRFSRAWSTLAETWAKSPGFVAAIRRGAASTNVPLCCATPKAATTSGMLLSLTWLCASPTLLKENQPTRLAPTVSTTAPPIPT